MGIKLQKLPSDPANHSGFDIAAVFRRLSSNVSVQSISKLILGTGLAQLVAFAATPFIARLYGPESFGEQSALLSLVGPMATLTSMAFPIAIVVARTDVEALALSRLAFFGGVIFSPLATLALLYNDMWLLRQLSLAEIGVYAALIPILVVFTTMNMSAGYMLTRHSAFSLSAQASVAAAAVGSISKLVLGVIHPGTLSLIVGNALGYLVVPLVALRLRRGGNLTAPKQSLSSLKTVANRHRDFPLLRAPQNFISAISQALPIIGLTAGFSAVAAGHYTIAVGLAGAPIMLIGNAAQSVLYVKLTQKAQAGGDASKILFLSTISLLLIGAPFFIAIAVFGAPLFQFILGPEWREAGVYAALLSPWLWLGLANRPAVALIPSLGLQRGLLFYEIIGTAAKVGAVGFGLAVLDSARWTVALFSAVGALAYFLLIVWVFWANRNWVRRKDHAKTS